MKRIAGYILAGIMSIPATALIIGIMVSLANGSGDPASFWAAMLGLGFAAITILVIILLTFVVILLQRDRRYERAAWQGVYQSQAANQHEERVSWQGVHQAQLLNQADERRRWSDTANSAIATVQITQAAAVEISRGIIEGIRLVQGRFGRDYFLLPDGTKQVASDLTPEEKTYYLQAQNEYDNRQQKQRPQALG